VKSVVIHGHFYQPPREDPWVDRVLAEPSAAPFHDWNERIEHECYGPLVANGALRGVSFDFGSTLFEWLERNAPQTYAGVIAADRATCNAVAQPYHHVILPLATRRDKVTEVRWGVADFRRRFGRTPEGMWLPETAVDEETLDVLALEGIQFTVLAPHQVAGAPPRGAPGRFRTSGGRSIVLFPYDGGLAQGVAFGESLKDARGWADQLANPEADLVTIATDGETYGHHKKGGDRVLAAVIADLRVRPDLTLENYSTYLARHPVTRDVKLVAPTSWSCVHGVERWRSNCGCKMAVDRPSQQEWRTPLRDGLNRLADRIHTIYAREYKGDPWEARDRYGEVVGRIDGDRPPLLELEKYTLRMFTSCGWFFDDIAGLEAVQILRYAALAIDLAGPEGPALESELLDRLAQARSNDPARGTGRDVFRDLVRGRRAGAS
jgi:alpha-amylase/alpha-mannosidase (GH57 family)